MKKTLLLIVLVVMAALIAVIPALADGPAHSVHVGGPDACEAWGAEPGCDANFSMVAIEHADGRVTGQWSDQFGGGVGFHVAVDCLYVDGNEAWIAGVVTQETIPGFDFTGMRAATRVVENGTNANDTPDQISLSFLYEGDCSEQPDFPLFDVPQGQVKVY